MKDIHLSFLFVCILLFISSTNADAANRTYDFHHSVGVNMHIHYTGTCYDKWDVLFPLVVNSKIKHYRDGLIDTTWTPYYQRNSDLGNAGIKGLFITDFTNSATLINTYPNRITSFEGYEGPNEVDARGDPNWVQKTINITQRVWNSRNTSHFVVAYTVVNRDSRAQVGDISSYVNYGSMHNYVATFNPETGGWGGVDQYGRYGSLDWNVNVAKVSSGNKPIMTTETGYSAIEPQTNHNDVNRRVQAKYLLRMLLYQYSRGIKRTIIYQMCEYGSDGFWSLVGVPDKTNPSNMVPKPSYYAIRDLLTLIEDTSSNAATFTRGTLSITLTGSTNNVRRVVLQKSNGVFYVALWLDVSSWDVNARGTGPNDIGIEIIPPPVQITVSIVGSFSASYYTFNPDTGKINSPSGLTGTSFAVSVSDMPSVLQLIPIVPTPAPTPKPTPKPTLKPTPKPTP